MEAYRDQYATLFNNGNGVVVLGVSPDPDTTLQSWAKDANFPLTFVSDASKSIATSYGDLANGNYTRTVFVISPSGKVTYRSRFNVMSADAYTQLGAAVRDAAGK
jgi:peroxiredoxin Q/BCP